MSRHRLLDDARSASVQKKLLMFGTKRTERTGQNTLNLLLCAKQPLLSFLFFTPVLNIYLFILFNVISLELDASGGPSECHDLLCFMFFLPSKIVKNDFSYSDECTQDFY
jgi:hypothetical protein